MGVLVHHHRRAFITVTQAAGRQKREAAVVSGLTRLDVQRLLQRGLNALIAGKTTLSQ